MELAFNDWIKSLKNGDTVRIDQWHGYATVSKEAKVIGVTRTGRIKLDNGMVANQNGQLRGEKGSIKQITQGYLEMKRKDELSSFLTTKLFHHRDWDKLSIDKLEKIYEIVKGDIH